MGLDTRPLGGTGLVVSPIGLGLAALGRPAYITLDHATELGSERSPDALEQRSWAVLDAAWALGVRYLDAAASYGRAEGFLASWLRSRSIPPDAVTVGSKWGYRYVGEWQLDASRHEVKDHSLEALQEQWAAAHELFGAQLGLYQVHSLTPDSPVLVDPALQRALGGIRSQGVRLGFSASGSQQASVIGRALELRVDGQPLFDTVQATWNLLERSAAAALAEAHRAGLGVIVKEVLANGRLAPGHAAAAIAAAAEARGTTTDRLAVAAALAEPWADVVLSGATTSAQVAAAVAATELADASLLERLDGVVEEPAEYWSRRAALPWT